MHEELFCLTAKQCFSCFIYACTQKRPNISFLCSCRVLLQHKQIKYEIVRNTIPDSLLSLALSLSLSRVPSCTCSLSPSLFHTYQLHSLLSIPHGPILWDYRKFSMDVIYLPCRTAGRQIMSQVFTFTSNSLSKHATKERRIKFSNNMTNRMLELLLVPALQRH